MNYPSGSPITVGDLIWWNEGMAIGRIAEIISDPFMFSNESEYNCFNGEPSVVIDTKIVGPLVGEVIYPLNSFHDEGIDLLGKNDFDKINKLYDLMKVNDLNFNDNSPHCVDINFRDNNRYWRILDGDTRKVLISISEFDLDNTPENVTSSQ